MTPGSCTVNGIGLRKVILASQERFVLLNSTRGSMLIFSPSWAAWAASLSRPHCRSWNNFEGSAATTSVFSDFMPPPLLTAELGVCWRASGTFTSRLQGIKKWLSRLRDRLHDLASVDANAETLRLAILAPNHERLA